MKRIRFTEGQTIRVLRETVAHLQALLDVSERREAGSFWRKPAAVSPKASVIPGRFRGAGAVDSSAAIPLDVTSISPRIARVASLSDRRTAFLRFACRWAARWR